MPLTTMCRILYIQYMGRPLHKTNKETLRYIIKYSGKKSTKVMGIKLGLHHSVIIYYQKKLRKAGYKINTFMVGGQSEADKLIANL